MCYRLLILYEKGIEMGTNVIAEVREQAHDANVANKIIDSLKGLKQNSDDKCRCRWVWELIQNAKDVVNSTGGVDIRIDYSEQERTLRFSHNGKPFTIQNIIFLIEQVSTKDRDEKSSRSTGKFGTGFMTTHLLSEKVLVSGALQNEKNEIRKIELEINRSEGTKKGIIEANRKSFEQLQNGIDNGEVVNDFEEQSFNTSFTYCLDQRGVAIAKEGLNSLSVSMPYVFMFVPEIRSVSVIQYEWEFRRGRIQSSQKDNIKVQEVVIKRNKEENIIYIASIQSENVSVVTEVERKENSVWIKTFSEQLPRLFCDFPLIGTEDFAFPAVVNSSKFNPTEPRNGIFLKDVDEAETNENKSLIEEAVKLYGEFLSYISNRGWKGIYNFVKIRSQGEKTWLSKEWVGKNIIDVCKTIICTTPIIDNKVGTRIALQDDWGETNIWIIDDTNSNIRKEMWMLVSELMPDMVTNESEIDAWYDSLWRGCNKFTLQSLVQYVQELKNINLLEEKICKKGEEWLNQLYYLISKNKSIIEYIKTNHVSIFPNQNGSFCTLDTLSVDLDIDEAYKDILNYVQDDCRNEFLDKGIVVLEWMNIPKCSIQDIFEKITNGLVQGSEQQDNIYSQLIVLYAKDGDLSDLRKKQIDFLKFADTIFPDEFMVKHEVSIISEELLEKSIKYLCTKVVDKISEYKNLETLDLIVIDSEESVEEWIARFIDFIKSSGYSFLLDRKEKTILPNQNGQFKAKEELFTDNGEMDETLKSISSVAGYDIKGELLLAEVFLQLPDNRMKGIADVAPHIISYVRNNQGSAKMQDPIVMDVFKKLYYWIKDNPDAAIKYFKDIRENIHWLYNDEEIAENMKKAEQIDAILEKYQIKDISILEEAFIKANEDKGLSKDTISNDVESEEELLIQYGIASEEQYKEALNLQVFKENFIYTPSHDVSKFIFVNQILERAKNNIIEFLGKKTEYDVSNIIEIDKTMFIIEKNKEQIYLIARPSDYSYVAIHYESEKNMLDYNKDWELWVEDGKKEPEKLTFGKILKLTGINKIPLKRI